MFLSPDEHGREVSSAAANAWFRELSGGAWSSHDLRKLARVCWQKLGIGEDAAERLLNHTRPALINRYMQELVGAKMCEALELWHGNMKLRALDLRERFGDFGGEVLLKGGASLFPFASPNMACYE
jgi:hypothetical protein